MRGRLAASSSRMTPTPWLSTIVPFTAPDRSTVKNSVGSKIASLMIGTEIVWDAMPAAKFSVFVVVV